ncbi:MAG: hypothetical protein WD557_05405 [Dehalococcoidia bacterium]
MARIILFALIASAAVGALAVFLRRRSAPVLDYEIYPPFGDFDSDFDGQTPLDEDGFLAPREDAYPHLGARTYN